ncbi:MAG: hypothetical protein EBY39_10535, partial [Flavobacteriia bacterium]|nr:hypothetical protein [Flavobacteriia bacterium]
RVKEFAKVDAPTDIPEVTVDQVVRESRTYQKTDRDNRIDAIGEKYTKEQWDKRGGDEAVSDLYMSGDLEAIVKNNLSSSLRDLPGFSEEDFVSETIAELIPHIKNFNIDRKKDQAGFGLSGWIRGQINNKIGNVLKAKKATREAFESDIEESTQAQVAVAEEQAPTIEEEDISIAAEAKKAKAIEEGIEEGVEYSTTRRALTVKGEQGIPDVIVEKVKKAVVKTMATEKTTPDSDKFIAKIKKSFLTELKKPIQDMMGKKGDFDVFLRENKEAIVAALPTSTLVQIERNVKPEDRIFTVEIKKNLSPTEVDKAIASDQLPKGTNRNSGPSLYEKRMPTTKEFVDFYNPPAQVFSEKLGTMVRSGLKGTRKDTLAEQLGVELAFDATMEVVQSPEVMERRSIVTNTDFADAQISELAKAIGRGVDIRFSVTDIDDANKVTKEINEKGLSKALEQDLDTIGKKLAVDINLNRTVEDYKNTADIPEIEQAIKNNPKKAVHKVIEQALIDNTIANENDFINVPLKTTAEGVNPDAILDFAGRPVGIETKADTARTPSRTIEIDLARYNKDKSFDYKDSYDNAAIENLVAKAMPDIVKIQKFLKDKYKIDWNGSDVGLTATQWQDLGFQGLRASVANSVNVDSDFASFDYLSKPITSEYINLGLAGLFKMGSSDPLYLKNNASEFGGVQIPLTIRLARGSSVRKDGTYRVTLKIEGQLDYRNFAKQKYNLFKNSDVKQIFDNASKIAKDKQDANDQKVKFSKTNIDERLNKMLETNKDVPAEEIFEKARAQQLGKNKGKYEFFISAGADDFAGLMTRLAGKGKQGDADMQFFKETLFDPYNRAYRQINEYNYNMLNDYSELIKDNPEIKKQLTRKFGDTDFTTQQAIRIYLWDQAGYDIPGMSEAEVEVISTEISRDADLRYFANLLSRIPKTEYPKPKDHWVVENIKADLYNSSEANRVEFLQEWQENADVLFSDKNLNKLEATMGSSYVSALKDSLFRMKTGKNRPTGPDGEVNKWLNWVNNSVGAAKAFANQKQYWSDFTYLFNSPTLKQRRAGVQTDVSASDIANAVRDKRNPAGAALAYLLRIGFTPTQLADSFAISAGGATYYRNQVNYYREQGQTLQEAEENAFADFQAKTEEAQQSSRPDKISKQQASVLGRLILAFQNTPMQYNRIIKKSVLDLVNRRGSDKSNISKIIYYGTAQSLIFSALQNALFALAFDDEKEEEEREEFASKKQNRILDGMIGTLLRGSGLKGAVADTLIKVYRRFASEKEKGWKADYGNVLVDAANISPPIGSKLRKLYSAMKTVKFNQGVMDVMSPLNIDNPLYDASSSAIEAATNIPTQRVYRKITNMKTALTDDIAPWQRIAIALGWSRWDVGLDVDEDITKAREEVKKQKKTAGQRCRAITSSGKRCKNRTENKSGRCFAHE